MPAGTYRMEFETAAYMARCHAQHPAFFAPHPFYPRVHVHFQIAPGQVSLFHALVAPYVSSGAQPARVVWLVAQAPKRPLPGPMIAQLLCSRQKAMCGPDAAGLTAGTHMSWSYGLQEKQHFHIPLTWNPYGYSTYRGS